MKVNEGSDKAAAHTLEVEVDEDTVVVVGDEMDWLWPWRGACRCSWRAFASAFS